VVHVSCDTYEDEAFKASSILNARIIVILAKSHMDPNNDSINFDLVHKLREYGVKSRIISEAVLDKSRDRMIKAGANNILRPIRIYPELLVRAIVAPGSEQVIETLFDSYNEECIRYDVNIKAKWEEIVIAMVRGDIGIPISYLTEGDNVVISNPSPNKIVDVKALYVIVREGNIKSVKEIKKSLGGL